MAFCASRRRVKARRATSWTCAATPGGLVRAGLDVARLWLDGEDVPVFNVRS